MAARQLHKIYESQRSDDDNNPKSKKEIGRQERQIKKTQHELQWIVAQRLLSALTIPGFS